MADRSVACSECLLDVPPVLVLLTSTVPASMFLMIIAIQEFKLKIPMTPAEGRSTQEWRAAVGDTVVQEWQSRLNVEFVS